MTGNTVLCAFVKDGNLYLTKSTDAGATWGAPVQKNNGGITVLEDVSSIDLSTAGIVFTDTRNGNKEIYYTTSFSAPSKPIITGPANGKPHKDYIYTLRSVDQENSSIWYFVDWGDGQTTNWDGPYESGTDAELKHTYTSKATFTIKAKAKNTNDIESGWATLAVTMPYQIKPLWHQFLELLFQRFPTAFPLLRQLMKY